ncbi:MAG TPA: TIGR01212 family radical SAM protein [Bacilli bacterium]|nr:TIGR01212 family radical SAM protein [Bacilli bacterium]
MDQYFTSEKNYHTLNHYLRTRFGKKVFKVSLNGGFTCPTRDGSISGGGCTFCSAKGSGDFAGNRFDPLTKQFASIKEMMHEKWDDGLYIAYFQANTNTYAPLEQLKSLYEEAISLDPKIVILSLGTRPDCLPQDVVEYLGELNKKVEVWVELGFQTMHEASIDYIKRGYDNACFEDAVKRLKEQNISIVVHIINGLPNETKEMMIDTVKYITKFDIQGIKIHLLHVMKGTMMGRDFMKHPFPMLTLEEYVDITSTQLRYIPKHIVIHRLTGDAPKNLLIAPMWSLKKFVILNEIDKKMRKEHLFQGDLYV